MCSAARGFLLVLPSDPSRGFVVLTPCQEKGTINKQLPCILSSHPFRTLGWASLCGQCVVALGTGCPCVLEPVLVSVRVRCWSRTVWKDLEQGEGGLPLLPRCLGGGCQTGALGKRRRLSYPMGLAVGHLCGQTPHPSSSGASSSGPQRNGNSC